MTYPATNLLQAAELIVPDSNSLHEIINGDATKSVTLVNGPVPTLRKALTDNFYFTQTTLPWEVGQEETIFNQLREFNGKFYHAPLATEERPISMGTSPDGDPNWRSLDLPVADMVVNAYNSSISAQQSKDDAAASAAAAEVSNQQSATNAATTTSDKNTIAGYRSDVEADRAEVAANTTQVASDKAEVATNTVTVSTDKATVEGYKNDAMNAKTEAQHWATGVSGSGVNTPSDSNNAFYYSEVARNNANQTFKSGGYFTPTVEQEYPDITSVEVDTIWLIKFASETGSFIYTTGDLTGETVKNGFMLVYDTPADTFDYIPTTLSGVNSINGITPDATGNITIDADDVGALPYGDVEFIVGVTSAIKGKSYLYDDSMWVCLNDTTETPAISDVNWYSLANPVTWGAIAGDIEDQSDLALFVDSKISQISGGTEVNVQTATAYTLVHADAFKMVTMDNADANTLTVPPNSDVEFPANTRIDIGQDGAGQTTIVADAGVTIRTPETLKLRKQWSKASLIRRDADVWDIVGDLEGAI